MRRFPVLGCSSDIAGTRAQTRGVAHLVVGHLRARGEAGAVFREYATRDGIAASIPILRSGTAPAVLISCGKFGERRARRVFRASGKPYWAHLGAPELDGEAPRRCFVPHHDWRGEFAGREGFEKISGVPHDVRRDELERARDDARREFGAGDRFTIACFVGGPNGAFAFDEAARQALMDALIRWSRSGFRVVLSTSRRTPADIASSLADLAAERGIQAFTGGTDNPYRRYLAAADAIVVTEDSITMTCEALSTGKPVRLLALSPLPGERLAKFRRFQRHFTDELAVLSYHDVHERWAPHPPIRTTEIVADVILRDLELAGRLSVVRRPIRREGDA